MDASSRTGSSVVMAHTSSPTPRRRRAGSDSTMPRKECADSPAKRPHVRWKIIILAESLWTGEAYHTRPGHERATFCSVESFCRAVMDITGWPLDLAGNPPSQPELHASARFPAQTRWLPLPPSDPRSASPPAGRKIVLAADEAWSGELYLTRPGLARTRFTSVEQLLTGIARITDWPLTVRRTTRMG